MADKTEIAVSVMPKLEERIVDLSQKLESVMREKAPEAWDAALGVVQIEAAQTLLWAVLGIAMLGLGLRRAFRWASTASEIVKENGARYRHDEEVKYVFGCIAAGVSAFVGMLITLFNAFDVWAYTALVRPELVIAKQVMKGLL